MNEQKFLEFAPKGYDPTMELKWIKPPDKEGKDSLFPTLVLSEPVLCQKWDGAFRSVWVKVPVE